MTWFPEPAIVSILLDANRVAPHRSHATDGIIGDASHAASVSDHNPDADGGVHACDITHDPAGGFDGWSRGHDVANRILAGLEHRVKYLVSNDGHDADMIFSKNPTWAWRQNGSYKTEHRSHLHVSILYTDAAENDQTPFFSAGAAGGGTSQEEPVTEDEINKVVLRTVQAVNGKVESARQSIIGTLQTNLRDTTTAIVAGVAKATGVDPKIVADAVAHELARKLDG